MNGLKQTEEEEPKQHLHEQQTQYHNDDDDADDDDGGERINGSSTHDEYARSSLLLETPKLSLVTCAEEDVFSEHKQRKEETSVTMIEDVVYENVVSTLLTIESIHVMDGSVPEEEEDDDDDYCGGFIASSHKNMSIHTQIQAQMYNVFELCGYHTCFRVAVTTIYSFSSTSSTLAMIPKKKNTADVASLISAAKLIRRILLQSECYKDEETSTTTSSTEANNTCNQRNRQMSSCEKCTHTILHQFLHQYFQQSAKNTVHMSSRNTTPHLPPPTPTIYLEKQIVDFINSILIVLPTQIANAYHTLSSTYKLPLWATRPNFLMRLVESSLHTLFVTFGGKTNEAKEVEGGTIEMMYCEKLMEVLLRHGHSNDVAKGLFHVWKHYHQTSSQLYERTQEIYFRIINQLSSSSTSARSLAMLVRSCLKVVIGEIEIYPTIMTHDVIKSICHEYCIPFLADVCKGLLDDEGNRDRIMNVMILSPSPSTVHNDDGMEYRLITRCIVELLLRRCSHPNEHQVDTEDLLTELQNVVSIWNDIMFINETDHSQQRHITSFILDSMDYFKKDAPTDKENMVVQEIVLGITNRLNITMYSIRVDGMVVAEKLAPFLGESLKFDELDGIREQDLFMISLKTDYNESVQARQNNSSTLEEPTKKKCSKNHVPKRRKERKKKQSKAIVEIDPDEEYASDESSQSDETNASESSTEDGDVSSNSEWGEEELNEFDLSDDEEDLRPVPRPKFLQECLDLLRCTDDDDEVKFKHETALEEITTLVRENPPDLHDMAPFLADVLVEMDNKYNSEMFDKHRWDGLCALTVCSPLTAVPILQNKLFDESALNQRLDILNVLKYSSLELCGQLEIEKERYVGGLLATY